MTTNKTIEDNWKNAGWIKCIRCGVYFHPLHTYKTDGKHCTECTKFLELRK